MDLVTSGSEHAIWIDHLHGRLCTKFCDTTCEKCSSQTTQHQVYFQRKPQSVTGCHTTILSEKPYKYWPLYEVFNQLLLFFPIRFVSRPSHYDPHLTDTPTRPVIMQLNFVLITVALLASASPAMSATLTWHAGAGCAGQVVATSNGAKPGDCISVTKGGSVKSIRYENVPNNINFFISGGGHDHCSNGSSLTRSGSGCATAPAG
jgi:hypothetical protein